MKFVLPGVAVAGLIAAAGAASAGGFVAPTPEPVVVEPVVSPVAGAWEGGYVGATLGYAFGGNDRFEGYDGVTGDYLGDTDKLKIDGANGGLRAGYRWQSGQWVFGPEISVEGGSVKDSVDGTYGPTPANLSAGSFGFPGADGDFRVESKLKSIAALKAKVGYEVAPDWLVTGHVGVTSGRFEYRGAALETGTTTPVDFNRKYTRTGYVVGLGVERRINDNWSVTGEIERNQFKNKDLRLLPTAVSDDYTKARPSFTNVKVGVNFNF